MITIDKFNATVFKKISIDNDYYKILNILIPECFYFKKYRKLLWEIKMFINHNYLIGADANHKVGIVF